MQPDPNMPPAQLSLAGSVVDKAIEYMSGQNIDSVAIASALLGGSIALLARHMDDGAIVRILDSAIASIRAGEVRRVHEDEAARPA